MGSSFFQSLKDNMPVVDGAKMPLFKSYTIGPDTHQLSSI
jgi:hypothetical protein